MGLMVKSVVGGMAVSAALLGVMFLPLQAWADVKYSIDVELNLATSTLSGTARIVLSGNDLPPEDVVFISNYFGDGRRLKLGRVTVNGQEAGVFDGPSGAAVELPEAPRGDLVLEIAFSLAAVPENEGIILLDDNRRGGVWNSWYPRVTEPASASAAFEVVFKLLGPGIIAHSASQVTEQESGEGRVYNLRDPSASSLAILASPIFIAQRAEVAGTDLGIFMREGSEGWAENLMGSAAEAHKYFAERIPGFQRERIDIVLAADDYLPGDFQPRVVVVRDDLGEMAERFGGVFAANYLSWRVSMELTRTYWAERVRQPDGDIPWLREGLVLAFAEKYADYALLGGPVFDNVRQFYLNAAASEFSTSLAQNYKEALISGLDVTQVLARSKGLWVVGMLERRLGRSGWNRFIEELASRSAGNEMTLVEIEALADSAAGGSIKKFFDDWVRGSVRLDYAVDAVRNDRAGVRVKIVSHGDAHEAVSVRAVFEGGEEKTREVEIAGEETWVEFEGGGELRRVEIDPDRTLPDFNRGNNFRSFGGSERIELLYSIDNIFEIGELIFEAETGRTETGREKEFALTISNLTKETRSLGLKLTTRFPGARNRGLRWVYVELAAGETRTFREKAPFTDDGNGLAEVLAEYFPVVDREAFEKLGIRSTPTLVNHYVVEVPKL
ncbi:MAG TPA: hypothetical protein VMX35_04915 [Acidobacteriota bacterium]|nr:hypothetical protein [Acidobacteriota bacterium]